MLPTSDDAGRSRHGAAPRVAHPEPPDNTGSGVDQQRAGLARALVAVKAELERRDLPHRDRSQLRLAAAVLGADALSPKELGAALGVHPESVRRAAALVAGAKRGGRYFITPEVLPRVLAALGHGGRHG